MATVIKPDMNQYHWLIFDADDTLYDFDYAQRHALQQAFAACGLRWQPEWFVEYQQVNGAVWHDFEQGRIEAADISQTRFRRFLQKMELTANVAQLSRTYLQVLSREDRLLPGAEETIRSLAQSHKLLLMTNGLKDVQRPRFEKSVLRPFFQELIISEETGFAKPQAGIFRAAFERMGQPPKEKVLMIGDKLSSDIKGGNDWGIDTCWYNPKRLPADAAVLPVYEISNLHKLITEAGT